MTQVEYPQMVLFVPCERASIDMFTNRITCSFIWESIQPFPFSEDDVPPEEPADSLMRQAKFFIAPINILTTWHFHGGNPEQIFEVYISIKAPDGYEGVFSSPAMIRFGGSPVFRQIFMSIPTTGRIFGLSVLSAKIRRIGEEDWHTMGYYPLLIEEIPRPQIQPSDAA